MTAWLVVLAVAAGSYALRAVMLATVAAEPVRARHEAVLRMVGPAAIGALTATLAFTHAGTVQPLPWPELAAVAAGFAVVRRTGNVLHAITVGLPTLWLLTAAGL